MLCLYTLSNCKQSSFHYTLLIVHEQSTNHISLNKNRPRCYAKSPTVQDMFLPILGLISCAGVTGKWGLLLYSAQFSWVFNFVNFQPFAKIFQQKFLTCGVQCVRAANLRNYFNEIFKNRYSQKNLDPQNLALYGITVHEQ